MQRKLIILGQVNFSIFAALIWEIFIRQIKFCAGKMKIFGCKNLWAHPPDSYREVRATDSPDGYRDSRSQVQVLDKKLERYFGPIAHPPDNYRDYREVRAPDSPDGYRDSGPRFKSWIKNLKDILGL